MCAETSPVNYTLNIKLLLESVLKIVLIKESQLFCVKKLRFAQAKFRIKDNLV